MRGLNPCERKLVLVRIQPRAPEQPCFRRRKQKRPPGHFRRRKKKRPSGRSDYRQRRQSVHPDTSGAESKSVHLDALTIASGVEASIRTLPAPKVTASTWTL